ncbi:hypothetical protein ACHAXT_007189 [Thalassiosira profunda]
MKCNFLFDRFAHRVCVGAGRHLSVPPPLPPMALLLARVSRSAAPSASAPASALLLAGRTALRGGGLALSSAAKSDDGDGASTRYDAPSATESSYCVSASRSPGNDDGSTRQRQRVRRRTRRRAIGEDGGVPSLGDFMHRAKVLKQYRSFVRLARFVDGNDGGAVGECRAALEEVRLSYKMGMKKDADALSKNMAFSEGERRLRELEAMVGYSPDKQPEESSAALSPESYDEDSWINIRDEEDPRGRVGVQWPWENEEDESK